MKKNINITLSGTVGGTSWGGYDAVKDFTVKFTLGGGSFPFKRDWHGLRDAVLSITDDGDFQHCNILDAYLDISLFTREGKSSKETRYSFPLTPDMKQISDSFISEKDRDKFAGFGDCFD